MRTWTVRATREVVYSVRSTKAVLDLGNPELAAAAKLTEGARRLVVVDKKVDELYGGRLRQYFAHQRVDACIVPLAADEANKTSEALFAIVEAADGLGIKRRSDPIIAIGGGVLTDVVGLAANLYRRGTPFVRVPTTLIGLIDAAVGVKTAINFRAHKNRLGSYYAAGETLLDPAFLSTLPRRHISNGLAEVIKMAVVRERALFDLLDAELEELLESALDGPSGQAVIDHAVTAMLDELQGNLWEDDLRRLVDFGHTFSPLLEMVADPGLLHGEAVAIDMALSTILSRQRNLVTEEEATRILSLIGRANLPINHPACTPEVMWQAMEESVRHRNGHQHCPLPHGIGRVAFVEDITRAEFVHGLKALALRAVEPPIGAIETFTTERRARQTW